MNKQRDATAKTANSKMRKCEFKLFYIAGRVKIACADISFSPKREMSVNDCELPAFQSSYKSIFLQKFLHRKSVWLQSSCHPKFQAKELRKPARLRPFEPVTRKRRGGGRNLTPSTSTRCWNKCTPTLASAQKPCQSWILSWTTFLRGSQPRLAVLLTTTREVPSPLVRSRQLSDFFSPVNLLSTLSVRAQKLSLNTPLQSRSSRSRSRSRFVSSSTPTTCPFQGNHKFQNNNVNNNKQQQQCYLNTWIISYFILFYLFIYLSI